MSFAVKVPDSIFGGWAWKFGPLKMGLFYHSLQCDQRWIFLLRYFSAKQKKSYRFGFRTRGDATPNLMTYEDAGWYWPWKQRLCAGRN